MLLLLNCLFDVIITKQCLFDVIIPKQYFGVVHFLHSRKAMQSLIILYSWYFLFPPHQESDAENLEQGGEVHWGQWVSCPSGDASHRGGGVCCVEVDTGNICIPFLLGFISCEFPGFFFFRVTSLLNHKWHYDLGSFSFLSVQVCFCFTQPK